MRFIIRYWLEKPTDVLPSEKEPSFVLTSLHFIFLNNTFCFENCYRQIKGTVIGTICAPIYARCSEMLGAILESCLDDIFVLFDKSRQCLGKLDDILNSYHTNLGFTSEVSQVNLSGLIVMVKRKEQNFIDICSLLEYGPFRIRPIEPTLKPPAYYLSSYNPSI